MVRAYINEQCLMPTKSAAARLTEPKMATVLKAAPLPKSGAFAHPSKLHEEEQKRCSQLPLWQFRTRRNLKETSPASGSSRERLRQPLANFRRNLRRNPVWHGVAIPCLSHLFLRTTTAEKPLLHYLQPDIALSPYNEQNVANEFRKREAHAGHPASAEPDSVFQH
jgi:hypothetical protein